MIVVGADKLVSFKTIDVTPPQPLVPFDEEARDRKSKKGAKEAKKKAKKGAAKKGKGKGRRKITGGGGNAFGGADKTDEDTQMASGGASGCVGWLYSQFWNLISVANEVPPACPGTPGSPSYYRQ